MSSANNSQTNALSETSRIQQDKAGNSEAVINPIGEVTAYIYDADYRVLEKLTLPERIAVDPLKTIVPADVQSNSLREVRTCDAEGHVFTF